MKKYVLRMKEKPQNSSHHSSCFIWCGKAAQIKREWKGGESKLSCASLSISNMFSMKNLLFSMMVPWRERGTDPLVTSWVCIPQFQWEYLKLLGKPVCEVIQQQQCIRLLKNIILRNRWELKKYKLIFDSCSRREICKLLVRGYSFATPQSRGELLKLMCSLDWEYKEHYFTMAVFIKYLYQIMLNGSDLET